MTEDRYPEEGPISQQAAAERCGVTNSALFAVIIQLSAIFAGCFLQKIQLRLHLSIIPAAVCRGNDSAVRSHTLATALTKA
jgi:hypothetical protein